MTVWQFVNWRSSEPRTVENEEMVIHNPQVPTELDGMPYQTRGRDWTNSSNSSNNKKQQQQQKEHVELISMDDGFGTLAPEAMCTVINWKYTSTDYWIYVTWLNSSNKQEQKHPEKTPCKEQIGIVPIMTGLAPRLQKPCWKWFYYK